MDPTEIFDTANDAMDAILGTLLEATVAVDGEKAELLFHLNQVANAWHDFYLCVTDVPEGDE